MLNVIIFFKSYNNTISKISLTVDLNIIFSKI